MIIFPMAKQNNIAIPDNWNALAVMALATTAVT